MRSTKTKGDLPSTSFLFSLKMITGGGGLLQAFQKINHLCLLLDILDNLKNVEVCGTSATNVDQNWLDEGLACKIVDLPRHSGRE